MNKKYAIVTFGEFKGRLCTIEGGGPFYTVNFGEDLHGKIIGDVLHFTDVRYLSTKEYFKRKLKGE